MTTPFLEPPAEAVARDPHWAAKMARLRARRLPERTVTFLDDQELKQRVTDAALDLAKARANALGRAAESDVPVDQRETWADARSDVLAAQSALDEARRSLAAGTLTLTFRALPRPAWEQLLREHAPTEEQADLGHEYNVETFPAALIASSSVDGMSEAEAQELLDSWSDADAKALFTAALLVNQTMRADLGKG
ncbi:hypothetical protein PV416_24645 [Streptomyces ipomoeae]|uniref:hypothetical protein n=1 Tax=Streptomyces ipomoeae TaxID=103232 RepID=UPI0029B4ED0A|nr:hypothetical protein [Streptomyces ipomoeae]MDX2824199.1 hypothetical protein [Streptomyces ipomoeae]MDX2876825.1 hypothetical protein [Streptomyces ipomoeae]